VVLGSHEKVAGLGWVVGSLLRNIVSARSIRVVPVAGESLSENGVQGLLDASGGMEGRKSVCRHRGKQEKKRNNKSSKNVRGLDVPSTQIEFDHRNKALNRVIDRGHRKKRFGVCHEAMQIFQSVPSQLLVGFGMVAHTW
jgi:hypothetical protein